jgi:Cupin
MKDPLSEIIALLQPRAVFSKRISGAGRWGVRNSDFGQPSFCAMLEGSCRLAVDGKRPSEAWVYRQWSTCSRGGWPSRAISSAVKTTGSPRSPSVSVTARRAPSARRSADTSGNLRVDTRARVRVRIADAREAF